MRKLGMKLVTLGLVASIAVIPTMSFADGWHNGHRQEVSNNWKGLAVASGIVGVLGFASHNDTLGVLGTAGAIYSGIRSDNCGPAFYRGPVVRYDRFHDRRDFRR